MELRYRATVEYDGSDFLGFQFQPRGRTVQGALEEAIECITRQKVRIVGAGRTDAGVHAVGQVIVFNVVWRHTTQDLARALNAVLPVEIAIRDCIITRPEFHPRYDALWRHYRYTVLIDPVRSPLWQRYAHQVLEPLDLGAMEAASCHLIGRHDFAAFGQPTQGTSTVRHVMEAGWTSEGNRLQFDIIANAFLRHMARGIVGTLLQVGRGRLGPDGIVRLLESRDRAEAGPPAPASGLCLMRIGYAE
jgi:tRNA pseudouridine38-40 synthase